MDSSLGRTMEDLFFQAHDQHMIETRRELEKMQETKENLSKVSGIKNEAVLAKLVALDIRPEILATLFAIPLIEVAWADGEMHEMERSKLLAYADKAGLMNKKIDPKIISVWLKQRPDPALMEAWVHYIQALSAQLSEENRRALKDEVMTDARNIAQAAGGFLGFRTISEAEQNMLVKLEAAFN